MTQRQNRSSGIQMRPKLMCSGIWGGIDDVDQDVVVGNVMVSLYSASCDGGKGGDIYFLASTSMNR
jgi:hypothetical protein